MFKQDPNENIALMNKWAEEDREAKERAKKHKNSSDGELLGTVIVITCYACYKAVEGAVKVTSTGSKILANAYKINTGKIEILGTDPESKTTYIARNPSPRSNTTTTITKQTTNELLDSPEQAFPKTPTSKREKVKVFGKKLLDSAKTSAADLSTAYKLTTGKIEVIDSGSDLTRDGREKFVFSDSTQRQVLKRELKDPDGYNCGIMLEEMVATSLTLSLNKKYIFKIKAFRSVILPDNTQDKGKTYNISLALKDPKGRNISEDDPAFMKIHYDREGKLKELSLPTTPIIFSNQWYPALSVYKGKLYSLPVNSGYYRYLNEKIKENEGEIKIENIDNKFTIELLGE